MTNFDKHERTIQQSKARVSQACGFGALRIDVYDVLEAFRVMCPARSHVIQKLLCAGAGHCELQDLEEARVALERAIELQKCRHGGSATLAEATMRECASMYSKPVDLTHSYMSARHDYENAVRLPKSAWVGTFPEPLADVLKEAEKERDAYVEECTKQRMEEEEKRKTWAKEAEESKGKAPTPQKEWSQTEMEGNADAGEWLVVRMSDPNLQDRPYRVRWSKLMTSAEEGLRFFFLGALSLPTADEAFALQKEATQMVATPIRCSELFLRAGWFYGLDGGQIVHRVPAPEKKVWETNLDLGLSHDPVPVAEWMVVRIGAQFRVRWSIPFKKHGGQILYVGDAYNNVEEARALRDHVRGFAPVDKKTGIRTSTLPDGTPLHFSTMLGRPVDVRCQGVKENL
jgi:hypothetical protein